MESHPDADAYQMAKEMIEEEGDNALTAVDTVIRALKAHGHDQDNAIARWRMIRVAVEEMMRGGKA